MFIKVQLGDTNKRVKVTDDVKTYSEFTDLVKNSFTNLPLPEVFSFYYYDSVKDRYEIENDVDFEAYIKEEKDKPKIIIKLPDEDYLNQSFFEKSKSNNSQSILKEVANEPSEDKLAANFKKENKLEIKAKVEVSVNEVPKLLEKKSSKAQKTSEKEEPLLVEKKKDKVNTTVHKNVKCNHCKSEVIGIRWKCLDQFDTDVCNNCYEAKVHKANHTMLKIETEDYISKINYRESIYRLFNPIYEELPTDKSVKAWIKEEDILQSTPQAVKQIWNACAELAKTVANEYQDWEKEWQAKGIKS